MITSQAPLYAHADVNPIDPAFEPHACVKGHEDLDALLGLQPTTPHRAPASASMTALAEIAYQGRQSPPHRYWITEIRRKSSQQYQLHFEDQNKRTRARVLTSQQANQILARATQIVWDAQYLSNRERSSRCTPYARLSTAGEQSKICVEHRKAATQSYALFNQIRRFFD